MFHYRFCSPFPSLIGLRTLTIAGNSRQYCLRIGTFWHSVTNMSDHNNFRQLDYRFERSGCVWGSSPVATELASAASSSVELHPSAILIANYA